jgi:hypothetical protein
MPEQESFIPQNVNGQVDPVQTGRTPEGTGGSSDAPGIDAVQPGAGGAVSGQRVMTPCGQARTVSPAVGRPLQSATELMKSGKYAEALAKAQQAESAPVPKTPYETCLTGMIIGSIRARMPK